jgi:hypothetical protein
MGENDKKPHNGSHKKKWNGKKKHCSKPAAPSEKFKGGKEELDGNCFDCTGHGQSNRFVKTVQKTADHIGQECKVGGVTRTEVITQAATIVPMPTRPVSTTTTDSQGNVATSPPDAPDISDCQSEKKIVDCQMQHQTENRQKIFSLVWQQCTESMHAKIKAHRDHHNIEHALDGIDLLRVIKLICFNIEDEKCAPQKVHETKAAFYNMKQGKDSDQACQIKFMNTVQVIEQCGASLGEDPLTRTMVCKDLGFNTGATNATELKEITTKARDHTLGAALSLGADPDRHSSMIRGLKNASLAGRDEWPKNVAEACNHLSKWEGDEPGARTTQDYEGTAFLSRKREPQPWHVKMTCRNCNKKGHIAAFCEDDKDKQTSTNVQDGQADEEAAQQLLDGAKMGEENEEHCVDLFLCEDQEHRSVSFQIKDGINGGRVPKDWILLDSQSTTDAGFVEGHP